jgi:uncharacterized repeat protein (TIGR01451 family)
MKTVMSKLGPLLRLGVTASALLLGQQALALGTDAGTPVSNQATVAYSVGGAAQTPIESDPLGNSIPGAGAPTTFLVDRRVSFTMVPTDAVHTPVAPGGVDVFAAYTLTNTGNAIMDYRLTLAQLGSVDGLVNGLLDTDVDMSNVRIRVANGDGAAGVPDLATDLTFVDELAEDATVVIYVFADAALTLVNGDIANVELTATSADNATATATPGVLDGDLAETPGPDDPTIIESVFADAGNDGLEASRDGFQVLSAALTITKTATVFSDPFGSGKAVPGAVIEYLITIANTGTADATNVSITDTIDADVTFVVDAYGAGQDVSFDSGASFCNADAGDADLDGCSLDGASLVVGNVNLAITVAFGTTLTIAFQVLIPNL